MSIAPEMGLIALVIFAIVMACCTMARYHVLNPDRHVRRPSCGAVDEWGELAQYNSECGRGIQHTAEMDARMAREQERFNNRYHHQED